MRRREGGVECGARGRGETHPARSGGAGAPPAGNRTCREELADDAKPLALPGLKRCGAQKDLASAVLESR